MKLLKYNDIEKKINEQDEDEDEMIFTSEEFIKACQDGNIGLLKDYLIEGE